MNESPALFRDQAMEMTPGSVSLPSRHEGHCGSRLTREDHLSLFQSSPSRVFASRSSRTTFSRRSSTGGIFPFIADLHASSSGCFHASVSTAAETVLTERSSEPTSSQEYRDSSKRQSQSPPRPIKFDTHRAFRRSSMPYSNVAFEPMPSASRNCTPNNTLYHDLDGKLDLATTPNIFAADARFAEEENPPPPSGESWTQQIKKLRESNSQSNKKTSSSLFFQAEDSLCSLKYSVMLQQKIQPPETPSPKNLQVRNPEQNCLTMHAISKQKLKIAANDLPGPALGSSVVSALGSSVVSDSENSPKSNSSSSSSPNVITTVLAPLHTEPIEEKVRNPINAKVQDRPADRQEEASPASEHSQIEDNRPAEYARHLLGLPARSNQQQNQAQRKGEEELYERTHGDARQHPLGMTLSADHQHKTNVEGEEEESWTSYHGLDGEMSEVTVTSFESYELLEMKVDSTKPSAEDGASLRCREEVEQLIGEILFEEQETLHGDVLSFEQVRALHSLPTENMEAILRYMEICRYENVATRWDLVADMIGNIEEQEADEDRSVDDEEQSVASSDSDFMGRSSCEEDICSIGSGGLSLEANTVECDSSISCSDRDDVTFYSEYDEEEVVEEEVGVEEEVVVEVLEDEEKELDETEVNASEHFQEPCQLIHYY
jgi:hypothetical protein